MDTSHGPLSGQTLGGKYLLGKLLGKGGLGAVYLAENQFLHRPQAVKVLLEEHFSDAKFRERFLHEARTLGGLDHAHIVHVDDLGMEDDLLYLVMPYISGGTLQDLQKARTGPLGLEEVTRFLEQMCSALSYAHTKGVVHLDLKPLNVLVRQDGRLLLADFGLAHLLEEGAIAGGTSLHFGSPLYMAPEQFEGQPVPQSDLYALGVILYQLLAGRPPFNASTPAALMRQHLMEPPPPLLAVRPDLPAGVETVLARALAKQPEQRYGQADELLGDFQAVLVERTMPQAPEKVPDPADGTRSSQIHLASTVPAAMVPGADLGEPTQIHRPAEAPDELQPGPIPPSQTQRCPHCGTENPLPMRFCGSCGWTLQEGGPRGQASPQGSVEAGIPLPPPPTALVGTRRDGQGTPGALAEQHWGKGGRTLTNAALPPGMTPGAGGLPSLVKRSGLFRSAPVTLAGAVLALVVVGVAVLVALKPFSYTSSSHAASSPSVVPPKVVITEFRLPPKGDDPVALTAGPDGNLWFLESVAERVGRITPTGTITEFPLPLSVDQSIAPWNGITTGPDDNLWFTMSSGEVKGNFLGHITLTGTITVIPLPGATDECREGFTMGPDGNLWCTERHGIGRITPDGAITEFPLPASGPLSMPEAMTVGPDGNLWFTEDWVTGKIGRITRHGVITEFPVPHAESQITGITTGPDGNLWFTESKALDSSSGPEHIGRITPSGTITEFPLPAQSSLSSPADITVGPDGNLWFTEFAGSRIGWITPSGMVGEFPLPTPKEGPTAIISGPGGTLWFTERNGNQIGRITLEK